MTDTVKKVKEALSEAIGEKVNGFVIAVDAGEYTRVMVSGSAYDISHLLALATARHTKTLQEN